MSRSLSSRATLAAALFIPLAILGIVWGNTYRVAQQGQQWLIPIRGYDPRDLLRGHFVQYSYNWPTVDASRNADIPFSVGSVGDSVCIEGVAPNISRVRTTTGAAAASEQSCAIVARSSLSARREVRGLDTGIYYASQAQAIALSRKLADPRLEGLIRVRIRPDGVMRPIGLEFRRRVATATNHGNDGSPQR